MSYVRRASRNKDRETPLTTIAAFAAMNSRMDVLMDLVGAVGMKIWEELGARRA